MCSLLFLKMFFLSLQMSYYCSEVGYFLYSDFLYYGQRFSAIESVFVMHPNVLIACVKHYIITTKCNVVVIIKNDKHYMH